MSITEIKEIVDLVLSTFGTIFMTGIFAWALIRTVNYFTKGGD